MLGYSAVNNIYRHIYIYISYVSIYNSTYVLLCLNIFIYITRAQFVKENHADTHTRIQMYMYTFANTHTHTHTHTI